ncbi:MAG: hypothetical protein ACK55I_38210, partial [bacterium]
VQQRWHLCRRRRLHLQPGQQHHQRVGHWPARRVCGHPRCQRLYRSQRQRGSADDRQLQQLRPGQLPEHQQRHTRHHGLHRHSISWY